MQQMREREVEYAPWFQALSELEQSLWWEAEEKRVVAREEAHKWAVEQNRLRQRGHLRYMRRLELLRS